MTSAGMKYRYLAALPRGHNQVFLSWRLLAEDQPDVQFQAERRPVKGGDWLTITEKPVVDSTTFMDHTPVPGEYSYRVRTADGTISETVQVNSAAGPSIIGRSFTLNPAGRSHGIIAGDLLNNGRTGLVVTSIRDDTVWLSAFSFKGKMLWEIDTFLPAKNAGWDGSTHHVPVLAWDINGDGRTEVVFHANKSKYHRPSYEKGGGPDEILIAVDGETAEPIWQTPWPATDPRIMMTVGHLQGQDKPADIVILDGTYGNVNLIAVNGKSGKTDWRIHQKRPAGHNLDIGDIDEDGAQEIICGGICYNGEGTVRWEAETFGHTDISKPCKIDPDREGLQIWYAVESGNPGVYLVDNKGKTVFKEAFHHAHYGWVACHSEKHPGRQPHTAEDARAGDVPWAKDEEDAESRNRKSIEIREQGHFPIFLPDGRHWLNLTDWQRKNFVPVQWDEGRVVSFIVRKENKRIVRLLEKGEMEDIPHSRLPENGSYGRNLLCLDVIGDYRENIITVDEKENRLMVLVNPNQAKTRRYSPCEDFSYRHDRSQTGSGYYVYLSPPYTARS